MMKRFLLILLGFSVLLVSCGTPVQEKGDAYQVVEKIMTHFELADGVLYSDREDADYFLSESMLERMFSEGYGLPEFEYVVSCAAYFSRRFSEGEIVVLKLCDKSHREELMKLCRRRAEKKENAVVYADGVYVYLICTDINDKILAYIK